MPDLTNEPSGPVRTCIGCRGRDSRSTLLRVVVDQAAGSDSPVSPGSAVPVIPDPRGRLAGRGAWLHPTIDCVELAVRRRAFARALRVQAPIETSAVAAYVDAHDRREHHHPPSKGTESGFDADERPMSTQQ